MDGYKNTRLCGNDLSKIRLPCSPNATRNFDSRIIIFKNELMFFQQLRLRRGGLDGISGVRFLVLQGKSYFLFHQASSLSQATK